MGWNSWDCYATTINEEAALANAAVMAEKLLPHGYHIFTIDAQWNEPLGTDWPRRADPDPAAPFYRHAHSSSPRGSRRREAS